MTNPKKPVLITELDLNEFEITTGPHGGVYPPVIVPGGRAARNPDSVR